MGFDKTFEGTWVSLVDLQFFRRQHFGHHFIARVTPVASSALAAAVDVVTSLAVQTGAAFRAVGAVLSRLALLLAAEALITGLTGTAGPGHRIAGPTVLGTVTLVRAVRTERVG